MVKIAIVTDSVACIPETLRDKLNIYWVAYYIHRGAEVLRDLVTIQREEFLNWMQTTTILPTTASPGPGDYFEKYTTLAKQGFDAIVSIHITSKASGAYQAAKIAKEMAMESMPGLRIEVIDTLNASMCQGWMVIEAARAALAGCTLEGVVSRVKRILPVTRMIQTADTLKYLYMGGRIGRAKHMVGTLLNIKPLITVEDGIIAPLGQARSRLKAYQMMVDLIESAVGPKGKIKIAYVHAGAIQECEKIRELVEARLEVVESLVAELSPALAVHTGPGTAGLCYYPVNALDE